MPLCSRSNRVMTTWQTLSIMARKFSFSMISCGSISASAMIVLQRPSKRSVCDFSSSGRTWNCFPWLCMLLPLDGLWFLGDVAS